MQSKYVKFSELVGETLVLVSGMKSGSDEVEFVCESGRKFKMSHDQDCCESVSVDDVAGDIEDLLGSPILMAEESSNQEEENGYTGSCTWTFYKFATNKGYLTLKWYGTSNGYYSEGVSFYEEVEE